MQYSTSNHNTLNIYILISCVDFDIIRHKISIQLLISKDLFHDIHPR